MRGFCNLRSFDCEKEQKRRPSVVHYVVNGGRGKVNHCREIYAEIVVIFLHLLGKETNCRSAFIAVYPDSRVFYRERRNIFTLPVLQGVDTSADLRYFIVGSGP